MILSQLIEIICLNTIGELIYFFFFQEGKLVYCTLPGNNIWCMLKEAYSFYLLKHLLYSE